ncbi:MAG: peroxiredoxin [bacterium]|nr:peroxiredoxin [bacterium]
MLEVGDKIPAFTAVDDAGRRRTSKEILAKPLVLYFYPKDDTPGCTSEAAQFRDEYAKFQRQGVEIVGVSKDGAASHQRFKEKYGIPFPLLADEEKSLIEAFGVLVEKNMYGKKSLGVQRSTFLIDTKGVVRAAWPRVKVDGHAADVLETISTALR